MLPVGPFGVGVFNVAGTYYALANRCPHRHGPVCRGRITGMTEGTGPHDLTWVAEGEILRSPWHAWEFRIASGDSITEPGRRVPTYPVHVEDGEVVLELREERRTT
jgi:nitrite reductase/ring-hydroxylating ferredoxin subunit